MGNEDPLYEDQWKEIKIFSEGGKSRTKNDSGLDVNRSIVSIEDNCETEIP